MAATETTPVEPATNVGAAPRARRSPRRRAAKGDGFAWDDRILNGRTVRRDGYGVRPRDVRHRATLVRAAVHPTSAARRPIVLLVLGALLGGCGWLLMAGVIVQLAKAVPETTLIASPFPGIVGVAAYLVGIGLFSWGWQLGDAAKALRFGLTIAVIGVALWLLVAVGALLLVALAAIGEGSGGSGESSGGSASHGGGSSSGAASAGGTSWSTGSGSSDGGPWDAAGRTIVGVLQGSFAPADQTRGDPPASIAAPPPGEPRRGICQFCGAASWAEAETCAACGATVPTGDDLAP